jgi:hypothetical protein
MAGINLGLGYRDALPRFAVRPNEAAKVWGLDMAFVTIIGRNLPALQPQDGTWPTSLKRDCIRPVTLLTPQDARRLSCLYVTHYKVGAAPSDSSRRTRCWRATPDSSRAQSRVEAAPSRLLKNHCSNHDARYNDFAR